MTQTTLHDLDELLLTIRDAESSKRMREAVASLHVGALRPAIVATWIAVVADLISKIRELAAKGDKEAASMMADLEKRMSSTSNRASKLQQFESDLLDKALNTLQFLSDREHADLSRLREDRNQCAHPAYVESGVLFDPTPELVRTHIVHAIRSLLQKQPVHGRAAVEEILNAIARHTFPPAENTEELKNFFERRLVGVTRPVVAKELIRRILKAVAIGPRPELVPVARKYIASLKVLSNLFPGVWQENAEELLGKWTTEVSDDALDALVALVPVDERVWHWLHEELQMYLKTHISTLPASVFVTRPYSEVLSVGEVGNMLMQRYHSMPTEEQLFVSERVPHRDFVRAAVDAFADANTFRQAENILRENILPGSGLLEEEDVKRMLEAVLTNRQIYQAERMPNLLLELIDETGGFLDSVKETWVDAVQVLDSGSEKLAVLRERVGIIAEEDSEASSHLKMKSKTSR